MEQVRPAAAQTNPAPDFRQAWQMALGDLRAQMSRADYDTWVRDLQPVSFANSILTVGTVNRYGRDWAQERLRSTLNRMLQGYLRQPVSVEFIVQNEYYQPERSEPAAGLRTRISLPRGGRSAARKSPAPPGQQPPDQLPPEPPEAPESRPPEAGAESPRKAMLTRAYGSARAAVIQPERGMFITLYFFSNWLPLLGHSAAAVILAARSMCYWNPLKGVLRNQVETDMADLARRASVSVRTVKDVLANPLVQQYFLRYKVRRTMTPNGVRTAGIWMTVRMDDPLTPEDQQRCGVSEDERWLPPDFIEERGGADDDGG